MPARYISHIDTALQKIDAMMQKRITRIVYQYERNLQALYRLAKTGRLYRRGRKTHVASGPGEAPAIDTGGLSQNVAHEITRVGVAKWSGKIGFSKAIPVKRVLALELGTLDGRLKKRPSLIPALRQLNRQMKQLLSAD